MRKEFFLYLIMAATIVGLVVTESWASSRREDTTKHTIAFSSPSTLSCTRYYIKSSNHFKVSIQYTDAQGARRVGDPPFSLVKSGDTFLASPGIDTHSPDKEHLLTITHIYGNSNTTINSKEFFGYPTKITIDSNCQINVTTQ